MDRNTQRYIATIAAGSRQQSRFIALMENYDRVLQLQGVAENSEGRADEQFSKFADTVEYKINQLKNSWEQLRTSFLDSDMFKGAIDNFTKFLDKINKFDAKDFLVIGTALFAASKVIIPKILTEVKTTATNAGKIIREKVNEGFDKTGKSIKSLSFLDTSKYVSEDIKKNLDEAKAKYDEVEAEIEKNKIEINVDTQKLDEKINELKQLNFSDEYIESNTDVQDLKESIKEREGKGEELEQSLGSAQKVLDDALGGNEKAVAELSEQRGAVIGQSLAAGITSAIVAVVSADNPMDAVGGVLISGIASLIPQIISIVTAGGEAVTASFIASTAGIGLAIIAVTATVAALGVAIKNALDEAEAQKFENRMSAAAAVAERAAKSAEEAKSAAKTEKESYDNVKKLKEEYEQLSSKQIKTSEEQEKYNELVEQIRDEYPEIVTYYNETTGELQVQNDLWEQIIQKQERSAIAAQKAALAASGASLIAQNESDRYSSISDLSSNTGLNAEFIENALSQNGDFSISADQLQRSDAFVDDINKLAEYCGIISEDGVFTTGDYAQMAEMLNDGNNELRQSLDGLEQEIEDQKQELIQNTAALVGDRFALEHPEAGAGGKAFAEAIGKTASEDFGDLLKESAQSYREAYSGNELSIYDALGGGPSGKLESNALSDWNDLDKGAEIAGLEYLGIKNVQDFQNAIYEITESWTEAQKTFDEVTESTEAFDELLDKIIANKTQQLLGEVGEEAYNKLSDTDKQLLEKLYAQVEENGTTLEELEELDRFLKDKNINVTIAEKERAKYEEASVKAQSYGLRDTLGWSDIQLDAFNDWIESVRETLGAEAAAEFGKEFAENAQEAGLSANEITAAFQAVDWGDITFDSMEDAKQQFINTMDTAMGKSFDQEKVEQLWKTFFATAEKYNVINVEITSTDILSNIKEQTEEQFDTILASAEDAQSAVKAQLTDGFINYSEFRKLKKNLQEIKLNAEDYVEVTEQGYKLNTEKLQEAYANQISDQNNILEQAKAKLKLGEQELANQINYLHSLLAETDASQNNNKILREKVDLTAAYARNMLLLSGATQEELDAIESSNNVSEAAINVDRSKIISEIERLEEERAKINALLSDDDALAKELGFPNAEAAMAELVTTFEKTGADCVESVEDNSDKIQDAYQKWQDAIQDVIDKQNELRKLTMGTEVHETAGDPLYNYDSLLERSQKRSDKIKEAIEDPKNANDLSGLLDSYKNEAHEEAIIRQAQNAQLKKGIEQRKKILESSLGKELQRISAENGLDAYGAKISTNISDYVYQNGDRIGINFKALKAANIPQDIENYVVSLATETNEAADKIEENLEAIEEKDKEFNEFKKKSLDNYVSLEEAVVSQLRDKYQEEVDNLKNRNDAMKDADDEYLDALEKAIEKERNLRDSQKEWDDLATQEKKLSLMQRDTSGANQIETQKLEKNIQDKRENLLDKSVDNIVNQLKELYATQQESREAEIEYMEAMLDNAELIKEASEIIASWQSPEDAINWWKSVADLSEMSQAQIEQQSAKWEEMYQAGQTYLITSSTDFSDALETSQNEIDTKVAETSDNVVGSVNESLEVVIDKVDSGIKNALEQIANAEKARTEAEKNYQNLLLADAKTFETNLGTTIEDAIKKYLDKTSGKDTDTHKPSYVVQDTASTTNIADYMKAKGENAVHGYKSSQGSMYVGTPIHSVATNIAEEMAKRGAASTAATTSLPTAGETRALELLTNINNPDRIAEAANNLYTKIHKAGGELYLNYNSSIIKKADIEKVAKLLDSVRKYYWNITGNQVAVYDSPQPFTKVYAKGGLVDYTGPAWVDGTKSHPEAFLSADDTARIADFTRILEDLEFKMGSISSNTITNTNVGDTTIEVHINIENVASDYDVDQAVERVKQDIIDAAKYTGSNVILKQ